MDRGVALVTGGARRVGRAIALHLAQQGYDVAFTFFSSENDAQQTVSDIRGLGVRASAIRTDLTEMPAESDALFTALEQFSPRLDVLINNASIYAPDSGDIELPENMYRIHVEAPLLLSRKLAPRLKASRGCIINMCDILAERPIPGWLGYCASKAALASLTVGLARELAPDVRVCGIAPGVAQWPEDYTPQQKSSYLAKVPLARPGTPQEVAALVYFLLTQGTYITGQIIRLDGGRSITW